MEVIDEEMKLCKLCKKIHNVKTVKILERDIYEDTLVAYDAIYEHCDNKDDKCETKNLHILNSLTHIHSYERIVNFNNNTESNSKYFESSVTDIEEAVKDTLTKAKEDEIKILDKIKDSQSETSNKVVKDDKDNIDKNL